jgi:hypothetical protein
MHLYAIDEVTGASVVPPQRGDVCVIETNKRADEFATFVTLPRSTPGLILSTSATL